MAMLRSWTVDQQIALLFVILFGLVLAATLGVMLVLRHESDDSDRRRRLLRDLRAVWLGSVVFWLAWIAGAVGATLLFGLFSFLALREFITLMHTRRGDHRSLILAFFVVLPLQYVIAGGRYFDFFTVFIPVYVFLAIPVASALQMLAALELYALDCYNVTQAHIAAVRLLDDMEALEGYDYTSGYPEKLVFNL